MFCNNRIQNYSRIPFDRGIIMLYLYMLHIRSAFSDMVTIDNFEAATLRRSPPNHGGITMKHGLTKSSIKDSIIADHGNPFGRASNYATIYCWDLFMWKTFLHIKHIAPTVRNAKVTWSQFVNAIVNQLGHLALFSKL